MSASRPGRLAMTLLALATAVVTAPWRGAPAVASEPDHPTPPSPPRSESQERGHEWKGIELPANPGLETSVRARGHLDLGRKGVDDSTFVIAGTVRVSDPYARSVVQVYDADMVHLGEARTAEPTGTSRNFHINFPWKNLKNAKFPLVITVTANTGVDLATGEPVALNRNGRRAALPSAAAGAGALPLDVFCVRDAEGGASITVVAPPLVVVRMTASDGFVADFDLFYPPPGSQGGTLPNTFTAVLAPGEGPVRLTASTTEESTAGDAVEITRWVNTGHGDYCGQGTFASNAVGQFPTGARGR